MLKFSSHAVLNCQEIEKINKKSPPPCTENFKKCIFQPYYPQLKLFPNFNFIILNLQNLEF